MKTIKEKDLKREDINEDETISFLRILPNSIKKKEIIDYRKLLEKYVYLIVTSEGCNYMSNTYRNEVVKDGITFTDEEIELIVGISNAVPYN